MTYICCIPRSMTEAFEHCSSQSCLKRQRLRYWEQKTDVCSPDISLVLWIRYPHCPAGNNNPLPPPYLSRSKNVVFICCTNHSISKIGISHMPPHTHKGRVYYAQLRNTVYYKLCSTLFKPIIAKYESILNISLIN